MPFISRPHYTDPALTTPQGDKRDASNLRARTFRVNYKQSMKLFALALLPALLSAQIRINCGGPAYTDSTGKVWAADSGFVGGSVFPTSSPIAGTPDQALYQTERYGTSAYTFTVPNGAYTVNFKFDEIFHTSAGVRLFDVLINGVKVLANFDIFAEAGKFKALDKSFPVTVTTGKLVITATPVKDQPKFSAIEIVPAVAAPTPTPTPTPVPTTVPPTASGKGLVCSAGCDVNTAVIVSHDQQHDNTNYCEAFSMPLRCVLSPKALVHYVRGQEFTLVTAIACTNCTLGIDDLPAMPIKNLAGTADASVTPGLPHHVFCDGTVFRLRD